jgi:predicted transposase YbfD/YdcC
MTKQTHGVAFLEYFSGLDDPRQSGKVLYPLDEVMLLVLCGELAGADGFVEIAGWGDINLDFLRRFLPFTRGVPSHDALNDLFNALDHEAFRDSFVVWAESLRSKQPPAPVQQVIAIDGKTSRRSGDKAKGRAALHLLSAWACEQRLVLGQEAVAGKENEIVAIPRLLEMLELTGALVTIDAIGCQKAIAAAIRRKGADYLLPVKENQPALCHDIELFFTEQRACAFAHCQALFHETIDNDHGRLETRRHWSTGDIAWLTERHHWADLTSIGLIEREVERNGKCETSRHVYISSSPPDAELLARAARAHWGIENRLHWVLDVIFHDDLCRLRTGFGPQNFAVVRHIALNLLKNAKAKHKHSLNVTRKMAAWSNQFLETVIREDN